MGDMIAVIAIIVVAFCVLSRIIQHVAAYNEAVRQIREEQTAQRKTIKQQQEEAKAYVARQLAIEKEQQRQAVLLAKHEEQIAKLEFSVRQAQSDIDHLSAILEDLNESLEVAIDKAEFYRNRGDNEKEERAKRRIITLRNQIHTNESKLAKAEFAKEQAERKLA